MTERPKASWFGRAARSSPLLLPVALGILFDWALLASLPALGASYGTRLAFPLLVTGTVRLLVAGCAGLVVSLGRAIRRWWGLPADLRSPRRLLATVALLQSAICLAALDAYLVEPFRVRTTHLILSSPRLSAGAPPVRLVHLSDTHVERTTRREREVVRRVNALRPDAIVMTGDYLNLSFLDDERARAGFRNLVAGLHAPFGIYAVQGSLETRGRMGRLFEGTGVRWLEDEHVPLTVRGQKLEIVGVGTSHRVAQDAAHLHRAVAGLWRDRFSLLLCHTPDLALQASGAGIDLYLAGHTHGGQVRLPWYGALVTASAHGKRFEMGRYRVGQMLLYVSRGLGMEGSFAPRARFLCPPEVVCITLSPAGGRARR